MAEGKKRLGRPPGSRNKTKKEPSNVNIDHRVKDDIWAIIIIAIGAFLVLAFQTEIAGAAGSGLASLFKGFFGAVAYIFPYYLALYGILLLTRKAARISGRSICLLLIIFFMIAFINAGRFIDSDHLSFSWKALTGYYATGITLKSGGVFGMYFGSLIVKAVGIPGLYIFSFTAIFVCLTLVLNTSISRFFDTLKERRKAKKEQRTVKKSEPEQLPEKTRKEKRREREPRPTGKISKGQKNILNYMKDDELFQEDENMPSYGIDIDNEKPLSSSSSFGVDPPLGLEEVTPSPAVDLIPEGGKQETFDLTDDSGYTETVPEKAESGEAAVPPVVPDEPIQSSTSGKNYKFPPISLLNKSTAVRNKAANNNHLNAKASKLEETLRNFNIDARVIQVTQGPAVTRYEIQPNVGVKVKSITNLTDDIALNLEAKSIRIEAPIPGKAAVGIEVENDKVTMVTIREIIDSMSFKNSKSKITFAVGKDISGNAIVADLKAMPHLLIAGSTGSGKSVCVNSIIASILYKSKPEEVKLVLIDPKVVELANYNGIPHLLIPVVTEPNKAAAALNWAVTEMDDRYKKFAEEGVRELESYNNTVRKNKEEDKALPQVVIIIDELADLMMAAPSQVEDSICRLAQKARAAGMHLIVATQRPSVDVITGVIKANIPSRIAFAVSSQFDSRTILDMAGAEKLVGKGDMLFNPMGSGKPSRVQGTFISDSEVHSVIEFVKSQVSETEYAGDVIHTIERANTPNKDEDTDELLPDAIETVVSAGQASVSMLQRRFRIGYNRAARIIDMMEARQIIGPSEGSKPRQVLMTEAELYAEQSNMNETGETKEN